VTWHNNVVGMQRVLDAVLRAEVPAFLYASSIGAYSPGAGRIVDESWPTDAVPTAAYGREKSYVERLLDDFEHSDTARRVVRFRPAFLFKEAAASEQRRIFAGPFVPGSLLGMLPLLPYPRGLLFQALHTDDAARAFHRAVVTDVRGAFNIAADPIVDRTVVAETLGARVLEVSPSLIRSAIAAAWHLRIVPAEPALFDLFTSLPLLDSTRARVELQWRPEHSAKDALRELITGMQRGSGADTAPLEPDRPHTRLREFAGVGSRVEGPPTEGER
jgi:nucleoside-diphosphate-sugar epimerase